MKDTPKGLRQELISKTANHQFIHAKFVDENYRIDYTVAEELIDALMQAINEYVLGIIGDKRKYESYHEAYDHGWNDCIDEQRKRMGL